MPALRSETTGFVRGGMLFLEPPERWQRWQRDIWNCGAARIAAAKRAICAALGVAPEMVSDSEIELSAAQLAWSRQREGEEATAMVRFAERQAGMSPGHRAYEADCMARPLYEDGSRRKPWAQLSDPVRATWERNPTPRR